MLGSPRKTNTILRHSKEYKYFIPGIAYNTNIIFQAEHRKQILCSRQSIEHKYYILGRAQKTNTIFQAEHRTQILCSRQSIERKYYILGRAQKTNIIFQAKHRKQIAEEMKNEFAKDRAKLQQVFLLFTQNFLLNGPYI